MGPDPTTGQPPYHTCPSILTKRAQHALFSGRMCCSQAGGCGSQVRASSYSHQACAEITVVPRYGAGCSRAPTAIASLGFPIPETPKFTESRGNLRINLRLAAGFISANEFSGFVAQDYDWPPHDLLHYELYMLSYRGISGGPLFNIDGQVVGLIRGGQEAYTYALRNSEVLQLLESNGVTYQKA
jgi:hypothetical protein